MTKVARKRRFALPLIAGVLLAIAMMLIGCGGSNDSVSTTSAGAGSTEDATSGGSLKTYSNGEYSYSFQYPEGWKVEEGSTADVSAGGTAVATLGVYDPDGAKANNIYIDIAQISVYKLNVTIDDSMMSDIRTEVENVLSSIESAAGDIEVIEALSETSTNGLNGFKITYRLTKENVPVVSTLYFLFSGDTEYQITVQAAEENWDAKKAVFDAMVASFKPTP